MGDHVIVAGFGSCPFHQRALVIAGQLDAADLVATVGNRTFANREQYRRWLFSTDGRSTMSKADSRAATHTSSPICWVEGPNGARKLIGGCDDLANFAAELQRPIDATPAATLVGGAAIRPEISAAHASFWASLLLPGTFLTPDERVQAVRVGRAARGCGVSKASAAGPFDPEVSDALLTTFSGCTLPRAAIDVIHRTVNDSSRAADGHAWYTNVTAQIGAGVYVELVALTASLTQVDTFVYALGLPLRPVPALTTAAAAAPQPPRVLALGQPTHVNVDARTPTVPYFQATDPITKMLYYGTPAGYAAHPMDIPVPAKKPKYFPNIMKCLSAAPSDHMVFMRNVTSMYLSDLQPDASGGRSISRAQIELLATKTSQLNNCAY